MVEFLAGRRPARQRLLAILAALFTLVCAVPAAAHPAPFSYIDLDLKADRIDGRLTVHVIDAAHELGVADPATMLDHDTIHARQAQLLRALEPRIKLQLAGNPAIQWGEMEAMVDARALRVPFTIDGKPPGSFKLRPNLFPYDGQHQSFVNIYEDGKLTQQWIFAKGSAPQTYFAGTSSGALEVIKSFVPSGMHHIWIGPDHLLFLLGLLLMGGSFRKLVGIVTAFTIGHSITLTLAALDIVTLPSSIVEPAIALTIVIVGADNLLRGEGRDLRFWLALAFGMIHGFGFASVLKEFGLPQSALGWSLFSFNVGVELGQLAVVVPTALVLWRIRRWSPAWGRRVATAGSVIVIGAGAWWFVQRVFLMGEI